MILNWLNMLAESFDLPILDWIAANLQSSVMDKIWPIITLFGEGGIFWIACAVLMLCFRKTRKAGFSMAVALLLYKKRIGIPALILACLIAFSRLYLYVHYPSDVIFSIVFGIIFGILGTAIVNGIYKKFVRRGKYEKA